MSYASCAGPSIDDASPLPEFFPSSVSPRSPMASRCDLKELVCSFEPVDVFPATKAIAAAAEMSVPAVAMRRHDRIRFRLNERLDFINVK